jgi:ATP-dependent exoDNAse (exonuclease V) alpha subunit
MLYVAISRAKTSASLYTNDTAKLISAIKERAGEKQTALANDGISAGLGKASLKSRGAGMG